MRIEIVELANTAPGTRFAGGVADLKVAVDGSTSTDQDGSITAYAGDFGAASQSHCRWIF